jgi:hypothetical protein
MRAVEAPRDVDCQHSRVNCCVPVSAQFEGVKFVRVTFRRFPTLLNVIAT